MYGNNPYMNSLYNPQANIDRINNQIAELEKMRSQIPQQLQQQPTSLTQNFQLSAPTNGGMKYANSIDEVQRELVVGDTPFFSKDLSILWIKNSKGDIKTYELVEIIPKDEKDMQIDLLMTQINELKGMIQNERINANVNATEIPTDTTADDGTTGGTTKKSKSSSISRISKSKKE